MLPEKGKGILNWLSEEEDRVSLYSQGLVKGRSHYSQQIGGMEKGLKIKQQNG